MKQINIKNLLVASGLIAVVMSSSVIAQNQLQHKAKNHQQVIESLNLTDEGRSKLVALMDSHQLSMQKMHESMQDNRYQAHNQRRALNESHRDQVKALLSEEQFASFEKAMWQQRHKGSGKGHRKGPHSGQRQMKQNQAY